MTTSFGLHLGSFMSLAFSLWPSLNNISFPYQSFMEDCMYVCGRMNKCILLMVCTNISIMNLFLVTWMDYIRESLLVCTTLIKKLRSRNSLGQSSRIGEKRAPPQSYKSKGISEECSYTKWSFGYLWFIISETLKKKQPSYRIMLSNQMPPDVIWLIKC